MTNAGWYKVTASISDGCKLSDSVEVQVSKPVINLGRDTTICNPSTILLDAGDQVVNYLWTTPQSPLTDRKIEVSQPGTYSVVGTNLFGCTAVAPVLSTVNVVKILPGMPGNFTASSNRVKQGQTGVIYTVPFVSGLTYKWTYWGTGATITGGTTNSVLVDFSPTATSGILLVTLSNGCGTSLPRVMFIIVDKTILKSGSLSDDYNKSSIDAISAKSELKVYPNPTSGPVIFEFRIGVNTKATLIITSMTGQRIATIFDADVEAGITQTVVFEKSLPTGTYLYFLNWKDQRITGKFVKTN